MNRACLIKNTNLHEKNQHASSLPTVQAGIRPIKNNFVRMKRNTLRIVSAFFLMIVVSCDEPETIVTNYVLPDGSILRKIEMRNLENKFIMSSLKVPFDSTWTVRDSVEISKKGDTTWIKRAEKLFKNVDELNSVYKNDSSANKSISRHAGFKKSFKWFNTEFRFSETIDKKLEYGYPAKDFLNEEELSYFYSPESLKHEKENGPDSLKFKALSDSVSHKTEYWGYKNLVSEFIGDFTKLTEGKAGNDLTLSYFKKREDEFVKIIMDNDKNLDSLWTNGILLSEFIGKANALKFKKEADSTVSSVTDKFILDFKEYDVRIVMPGKVLGSNGFIDSSQVLLWPVKSDYFLSEPYEMCAESKATNIWAWIVSGLFLLFVFTGVIIRIIKKAE